MDWREIKAAIDRATETVTGSIIARSDAKRNREGWRAWRAQWAAIGREPPANRTLTVCRHCERFHSSTGEWIVTPPALAEMLHDPKLVQVTHGACPVCMAGRLDEPTG